MEAHLHTYTFRGGHIYYAVDGGEPRDITWDWFGAICEQVLLGVAAGIRDDIMVARHCISYKPCFMMRRKIRRYARGIGR